MPQRKLQETYIKTEPNQSHVLLRVIVANKFFLNRGSKLICPSKSQTRRGWDSPGLGLEKTNGKFRMHPGKQSTINNSTVLTHN
mmetsp:Transcript_13558/g.23088  ORF Transcript_13558/g.23088 Transcript_13558/m.23088 type:complete len:84 (+) Transcript_13558:42-293(+)